MAEIGLAVSIISFVNQGIAIAQQLNDYSSTATDVPRSLVHIKAQLPLLLDALNAALHLFKEGTSAKRVIKSSKMSSSNAKDKSSSSK
jgi:hypothetical protein